MRRLTLAGVLSMVLALSARGGDGFVPMFNGKDLAGWVNVNCAPGTFFVKDGEIITTGHPTGYLRTARRYENFIADFEWMHVNRKEVGNSGFFVWADPLPGVGTPYTRGIEVQVLVNLEKEGYYTSQGDLFSIHGARCVPDRPHPHGWERCLPSERRCKGGGEWNHYRVIANDGTIKLHVNGKEVSGLSKCRPRAGYLALESEGAECHFRNLKIKELPSTHPKPDEVARDDTGFQNLYTGLDLAGWKAEEGASGHWQPRDWTLHYDGKAGATMLRSAKGLAYRELVVDFRFPAKGGKACTFGVGAHEGGISVEIAPSGPGFVTASSYSQVVRTRPGQRQAGEWNRLRLARTASALSVTVNDREVARADGAKFGRAASERVYLAPLGEMDFANLFVRPEK